MFGFPGGLKTLALAALGALAISAAAASPASAHERSRVHCDRDGYRCVRVVCDRDGDRCRRVAYINRDHDRRYRDDRRYRHGDGDRYRRDRERERNRAWVCNRYGYNCHWVSRERVRYQPLERGGLFIRLNLHP